MKFRTTLAALAAVATLSLAACGSDDDTADSSAPAASSPVASAPAGSDAAGSDAAGSDAAGSDAAGSDAAGSDAAGSDAAGSDAAGSDAAGSDAAGSDAAGSDAAGSDAAGSDAAGSDAAGSEAAGSDAAGSGAGVDAGACQGVLDILQDLPGLITKVTGEGVTQADVDAVFTEERMSSIPEDLVEPINQIKDQATALVGKSPADAAKELSGLGSSVQELSGKVQSACAG